MAFKRLAIGNDHTAVQMKQEILSYLAEKGYELVNVGTDSEESCNYPIFGFKVAKLVATGEVDGGILICGTGVGIGLAANKVKGIRCVTCSEPYSARLARMHNNANCLSFGARVIGVETAKDIVDAWLGVEFEGGRHASRVSMLREIERTHNLKAAE